MIHHRRQLLVAALCAVVTAVVASTPPTVRADDADRIAALLGNQPDIWIMRRMDAGVVLGVGDRSDRHWGEITISTSPLAFGSVTTPSFYVRVDNQRPDPELTARMIHLANTVVARDDGRLGFTRQPRLPPPTPWILLWEALAIGFAAGVVALIGRVSVIVELKLPHLLPAILQSMIFAYWAVYWRGFIELIPSILLQMALAYAVDALVMLAVFGRWKVGFGPVPIVLSANLFNWFDPNATALLVVAAVCSRALIRYRGRHVLNPSAFGLTVALALTLAFPSRFIHGGPFILFTLAPNLSELIILLALIPQVRFRIVLASVGVYIGLTVAHVFYSRVPGVLWPGVLLMMTLFVTDPATMPRTPVGQLLFGGFIGVGVAVVTAVGYALGAGDERLNKVLPVTVANVLVPAFDHIGDRLARWRPLLLEPRWNLAHVAVWLALVGAQFGHKEDYFYGTRHWSNQTPLIVRDADGVPRCENNPIFCRPFTFVSEAQAWAARLRRSTATRASSLRDPAAIASWPTDRTPEPSARLPTSGAQRANNQAEGFNRRMRMWS